jgi:hypothetical protein
MYGSFTAAGIGTNLMNEGKRGPFWEKEMTSQPPLIGRENSCAEESQMSVG